MRAILEDAIECFQKQFVKEGQRTRRLGREAEEWIFADDYRWPFSFVNICAVLGLDAAYIRRGLEQWRQAPLFGAPRRGQRGLLTLRPLPAAA
jgi:hypothetical protein